MTNTELTKIKSKVKRANQRIVEYVKQTNANPNIKAFYSIDKLLFDINFTNTDLLRKTKSGNTKFTTNFRNLTQQQINTLNKVVTEFLNAPNTTTTNAKKSQRKYIETLSHSLDGEKANQNAENIANNLFTIEKLANNLHQTISDTILELNDINNNGTSTDTVAWLYENDHDNLIEYFHSLAVGTIIYDINDKKFKEFDIFNDDDNNTFNDFSDIFKE